jgi:beta-lactamase class A
MTSHALSETAMSLPHAGRATVHATTRRATARRALSRSPVLPLALALTGAAAFPAGALAQGPGLARLQAEVERLAGHAGGRVGVGAIHLESGDTLFLNADEGFPMASTYKVPVATRVLDRVDRGELRLDSLVRLAPGDLHPGSGTLTALFDEPGVTLPLHTLIELMLLISDNSATDLVLEAAGGAGAVTGHMRAIGLDQIRVDRPTVRLIADWIGIEELPSDDVDATTFEALSDSVSEEERAAAAKAFDADPRDTATPRDMAALLAMIHRREILSEESSARLLDIMRRSTTGAGRIKGLLPPEVEVGHKTGTIGGTTNDVGVIELPDGAGHVALAVFVKASERDVATRERAIAQIARAVYDYFLYTTP